jgi:hypothetical protein
LHVYFCIEVECIFRIQDFYFPHHNFLLLPFYTCNCFYPVLNSSSHKFILRQSGQKQAKLEQMFPCIQKLSISWILNKFTRFFVVKVIFVFRVCLAYRSRFRRAGRWLSLWGTSRLLMSTVLSAILQSTLWQGPALVK